MQEKQKQQLSLDKWLPITAKEMKYRGWEQPDVVLITGDAYVDHPSFANAMVGRYLESLGLKVALVPQPNWQDDLRDFKKMGTPRLFFAISAGNMDSMVNHYTANKRLRSDDAYTPDGKSGFRPDYASIVYSRIAKKLFPEIPVVLGGVEASMRRLTHYDFWTNQLKPSILEESKADILVYGMGERSLKAIVDKLEQGKDLKALRDIPQIGYLLTKDEQLQKSDEWENITLNSHELCLQDKRKFAENFATFETESNKWQAARLIQEINNQILVINPAFPPMEEIELDAIYDLPYTRLPHPKYQKKGTIPAYEMIRHSISLHRGCFGGCSFCTIVAHQGKFVSSRSSKSIHKEVEVIKKMPDFKGYISDLGGPSANMYQMQGKDMEICKKCKRPSCLFPAICKNLDTNPAKLTQLYSEVRKSPGIKKAFVGSGVRYDLFMNELDKKPYREYAETLIQHHVSGRLKVAPEHTSERVLKLMRKPSFETFHAFRRLFNKINEQFHKKQQLIPYFISSHPGSTNVDMAGLSLETKKMHLQLEQVQDFTPTPMTLATVMFYTGLNPYTMEKVHVARSKEEKLAQRNFFFWYKKEYKTQIIKELKAAGRGELIPKLFQSSKDPRKLKKQKRRK